MANKLRTKESTVYSLRHEYTARMRNGAVPEHIQRHIVGHATDVHGTYGAFPDQSNFDDRLAEMAVHMGRVALPFDMDVI
ncbi:hypothetical protein [Cohaesibacter celericrescens]|uniref:hypothetical protein n=1 Tax=Cohaesibacter celericrescens TaxID=2067669 RepID=UPI0011AFC0C9|nr:hypothetical protein [Cohaesibacter celericrescens]